MPTVNNTGSPAQLWTNQYLSDLAIEAEITISTEVPCIYVRFPLTVTAAQSIYDFQTDTSPAQRLTGIIRVTWEGHTVWPVFQQQLQPFLIRPNENDVRSGRPYCYIRTGYGQDGIKFFPSPSASIAVSGSVYTQAGIAANVIVSGWRIANPSCGTSYRIPDYIRETLVRYYVMSRAYRKEGKGQNLDASRYFAVKYDKLLSRFKTITSQLFSVRYHGKRDIGPYAIYKKPPRPSLPSNFGEPVY
jgi:hypothetical protein